MIVEIRDMNSSDWESVADIYCQGLLLGKSAFQTECPTYEEWDKGHLKECRFVLTKDSQAIGWAALSPRSIQRCCGGQHIRRRKL